MSDFERTAIFLLMLFAVGILFLCIVCLVAVQQMKKFGDQLEKIDLKQDKAIRDIGREGHGSVTNQLELIRESINRISKISH